MRQWTRLKILESINMFSLPNRSELNLSFNHVLIPRSFKEHFKKKKKKSADVLKGSRVWKSITTSFVAVNSVEDSDLLKNKNKHGNLTFCLVIFVFWMWHHIGLWWCTCQYICGRRNLFYKTVFGPIPESLCECSHSTQSTHSTHFSSHFHGTPFLFPI